MVGARLSKKEYDTRVGKALQQARLARGLTLSDASVALRIPLHQLKSLEACELHAFDAELYARSAFEKYAGYLGLETKTKQAFLRLLSGGREVVPLKMLRRRSWLARVVTPYWILMLMGSAVAGVVGTYIIWQVQTFLRLPALALREPVNTVVDTDEVLVRGASETNAAVTVNDQPVLLASDGSFELRLTLHPGVNVVRVEAKNAADRERVIERDLLRTRQ